MERSYDDKDGVQDDGISTVELKDEKDTERGIEEHSKAPVETYELLEEDGDYSKIPIDRGYAWFVVLGCFLMMILFVGTFKSVGILFVEILEIFEVSTSLAVWMIALYGTVWAITAPFAAGFSRRYTNRVVVMFGGFLSGIGCILAAVSPNIGLVILFYGFVCGIGVGLVYGPSLVMVALYFEKRRAISNAIAVTGGAIGSLAMPPLLRVLLDQYGYKNALLILGALMFNIIVSGALYRPLSFYTEGKNSNKCKNKDGTVYQNQDGSMCVEPGSVSHLYTNIESNNYKEGGSVDAMPNVLNKRLLLNRQNSVSMPQINQSTERQKLHTQGDELNLKKISKSFAHLAWEYGSNLSIIDASLQSVATRKQYLHRHLIVDSTKRNMNREPGDEDRTIIKRSGCLQHLNCCGSSTNTDQPPLFDYKLMKNPIFLIFSIAMFLANCAYSNQFIFLPPYCNDEGISKNLTAIVMSVIGVGDFVGRIVCGLIADTKVIKPSTMMAITLIIPGVFSILLPFIKFDGVFFLAASVFGFFGGPFIALMAVVFVDWLGKERLSAGFGQMLIFFGLAYSLTTPVIGTIRQYLGSYDIPYIILGIFDILAGLLILSEAYIRKILAPTAQ
ncbi:unnamed protein product [Owenia fusiformis]|uniref:Uncharacterized protein n=1 Tax=Owenia fusiformis TaxID=6347 RepID=A0A8J1YCM7_OWEFU|nr:unnamed protein product [Owenia fusiformis]